MSNSLSVFKKSRLPWRYYFKYNITQPFRWLKYAWQRATRGYCDKDIWDLDDYYLKLFCSTLLTLKETRHGYPSDMTGEKWDSYLMNMAMHFRLAQDEYWDDKLEGLSNEELIVANRYADQMRQEHFDEGMKMLHDMFFHLWD